MIYLDAASTVATSERVQERLQQNLQRNWGNVSGGHAISLKAKNMLEHSREICANLIGAAVDSVIFTSSATEALNIAIQGYVKKNPKARIFYSAIEHPAVKKTVEYLQNQSSVIFQIPADANGQIDMQILDDVQQGDLVCIMAVNNEIGTVNDIAAISEKVQSHHGKLLVDAVQSLYVYSPKDLVSLADYLVLSGHKLGAPQGIALLYLSDRKSIDSLCFGGSQEYEIRPGTTPAWLADSFALVLTDLDQNRQSNIEKLNLLNQTCEAELKKIDGIQLHCELAQRTPHIIAINVVSLESQMLVAMLDEKGICLSKGSACASGASQPSHVLTGIGFAPKDAKSTLRISFSPANTQDEIITAVTEISHCIAQLKQSELV